jgi:hypothetical protein
MHTIVDDKFAKSATFMVKVIYGFGRLFGKVKTGIMKPVAIMRMEFFISVSIIVFIFCGCGRTGGGASYDIKDSQNRGVFIAEYKPLYKNYKINDTLTLKIEQIWIETHWIYSSQSAGNTFILPGYQLNVNYSNELKGYPFDWCVGVSSKKYLRSSSLTSLMGDFEDLPGDTIKYKVQKGDNLSDSSRKEIIGELVFIKKK